MINYQETDLNRELARSAHYGTSQTPDIRAKQEIAGYMAEMELVSARFVPFATETNEVALKADLEQYRLGYLKHLNAQLAAKARCMSTMVTGPSNFNYRRNEKANNTEHRRTTELLEWREKALNRLNLNYNPVAIAHRPIRADEPDAIEQLQVKVAAAEKLQATMKTANTIIRQKKGTVEGKTRKLIKLGFSDTEASQLFQPDFAARVGFPSYRLTNNNANIKRMKARIATLQAEANLPEAEDRKAIIGETLVTIVENREEERLQLLFAGKPPADIIKDLKFRGFNWSRTHEAWQRLLNDNARRTVAEIISEEI